MRFLADEGVDNSIVLMMRKTGFDVLYIAEFQQGMSDEDVLSLANTGSRILITRDKDFGELVFRLKKNHSGVILYRLDGLEANQKAALMMKLIHDHEHQLLSAFTVLQPKIVRIRLR